MMRSALLPLCLAVGLCLSTLAVQAQEFSTAIGARLGLPLSLSAKHFLSETDAVEAYVGFRGNTVYNWISINAAYQRHQNLGLSDELSSLNWYYGAGAGLYIFSYDLGPLLNESDYSTTAIGISGYLGLQYAFESLPVEVTVDWVPTILLGSGYRTGFQGRYAGLGVRYILGR